MWHYMRTLLTLRIKMLLRPSPRQGSRRPWLGLVSSAVAVLCVAAAVLLVIVSLFGEAQSGGYLRTFLLWCSTAGVTFLFLMAVPALLGALTTKGDLRLLLLTPVASWWVVLEKLIASYLRLLGLALLPSALVVAGLGLAFDHPCSYWPLAMLAVLLLPAAPLAAASLLTVAVLRWIPPARARAIASLLGAGLGLAYYAGSQLLAQRAVEVLGSGAVLEWLGRLPTSWPGQALALALQGDELMAAAYLLGTAVTSAAAGALGLWLSVRVFELGWASFQEVATSRRAHRSGRDRAGARPPWWSLASKDWKELRRDPQHLVGLLYPLVIFGAGVYRSLAVASTRGEGWPIFTTIDMGMYFMIMTLAQPSINREGRRLYLLALCPLSPREIFVGKWLYAAVPPLALATALDIAYGLWAGLHPLATIYMLLITTLLAVTLAGVLLWVAVRWPRLDWQDAGRQVSFVASAVGGLAGLGVLAAVALPALGALWLWDTHPLLALPLGALPLATSGLAIMVLLTLGPLQLERLLSPS